MKEGRAAEAGTLMLKSELSQPVMTILSTVSVQQSNE